MSEWFRWAAAFFLGALSTVAVEFGRTQLERRQRQQDRLDERQRQILDDLLEAIATYRSAVTLVLIDNKLALEDKNRGSTSPPSAWRSEGRLQSFNKYTDATLRVDILRERVADDRLRELVSTLLKAAHSATKRASHETARVDSDQVMMRPVNQAYEQVMALTGELLRRL